MSSRVLGRFDCDGQIYTKYPKGIRAKERFSGRKASWTEAMTRKHIQRSLGTAQKAEKEEPGEEKQPSSWLVGCGTWGRGEAGDAGGHCELSFPLVR